MGKYTIATANDFTYNDPVDDSVSNVGWIPSSFLCQEWPDLVPLFYESDALEELVKIALDLCDIKGYCGTETPTVIT